MEYKNYEMNKSDEIVTVFLLLVNKVLGLLFVHINTVHITFLR